MNKARWFFAEAILLSILLAACASRGEVSLPSAGVKPEISVMPGSLSFGNVTVGGSGKQSLTVTDPGSASLSIASANVTGAGFSTSGLALPVTIAAGGSATITVGFEPSSSGSVSGSLTLASNAPTSPTAIAVSGTGVVATLQLTASPASLNFTIETVGSNSSQNVTLTNSSSTESITITTITVSVPFAAAGVTLPVTLSPGHGVTLGVTFTPTVSGSATGMLAVASTAGNSPTTVALAGTGGSPTGSTSSLSPSGPIVIDNQNGTVIQGLKITSTTGDCVRIVNSTNITIQNSEIGPCTGGSTANAISIVGGNGINIYDNYIHQTNTASSSCCDTHDGILATGGTTNLQNLTIQGNVIAYGESNIEIRDATTVTVVGNFLLNPIDSNPTIAANGQSRGQNFQCWQGGLSTGCTSVTFENNYALSSLDTTLYTFPENQEDSINFGATHTAIVQNNYISGGHSPSGCGLIADFGANNISFKSNLVQNTGQCGIGIADGTNNVVDSNKVYNTNPVAGGGNTAIYTWKQYTPACGPTTVSNNIADEIQPNGSHSGFWDGGGCSDTLSGNAFGQPANPLLTPTSNVFVPPLIPPQPKNCVVASPYSTQTGWPACAP